MPHTPTLENPFAPEKHRSADDPKLIGKILGADAEAAMRRVVADKAESADNAEADGLDITPEQQAKFQKDRERREGLRHPELLKQARVLFDKGWGEAQGIKTFEAYLETIPPVPKKLKEWEDRFDRLILVDARIPLTKACALADLKFNGDDTTLVSFDPAKEKFGVRWMYCHDGRKNNNRFINDCRADFLKTKDETGLDAIEGVMLYINDPTVIDNRHFVKLLNSVSAGSPNDCACIGHRSEGPMLSLDWADFPDPFFGFASRGEWPK